MMNIVSPAADLCCEPYLLVKSAFEHFPIALMQKHQVICGSESEAALRLKEMLAVRDMIAGRIECPDGYRRAWLWNWGPGIVKYADKFKVTMRGTGVCLPAGFVPNDEAMDDPLLNSAEKMRLEAAIWRG